MVCNYDAAFLFLNDKIRNQPLLLNFLMQPAWDEAMINKQDPFKVK